MYQLYYLPFSIQFKEGRNQDDVLPFIVDPNTRSERMLRGEELQLLDSQWEKLRASWIGRSLWASTTVKSGQSIQITRHLSSHNVPLNRNAFDHLSVTTRMQLNESLKTKSPEQVASLTQEYFLKGLVKESDTTPFNFFIVGASWCDSCREYRTLLETYYKMFPDSTLNLHSVVIEDPKEQIFDSKLLKDLFPHPKKYSHDSIPRFLALEIKDGKTIVWEEGEALRELYRRYFSTHRGFLDKKTSIFLKTPAGVATPTLSPQLSGISR